MLREQAVNETGIALHVNACVIDRIEFGAECPRLVER